MKEGANEIDFGVEMDDPKVPFEFSSKKEEVNSYDIFKLAKWILGVSTSIYLLLALIRIYYPGYETTVQGQKVVTDEGIQEVWEYSKVFLNSIISLILGLYFGAKAESKKPN